MTVVPVQRAAVPAGRPAPRAWVNRTASTWTRLDVGDGVCVVHVEGTLGISALQPCRAALDAACEQRPAHIVLDLSRTAEPEPTSVALLGATRRYLRTRGVPLVLGPVPLLLRQALQQARVLDLYQQA